MQIGIVGGTGPAGSGLAARLAASGHDVVIGSRSEDRAVEVRDEVVARWADRNLPIRAGGNQEAASAEVVVIATPWEAAAQTASSLADELSGSVVISMANAIAKVGDELQPMILPRGSVAEGVQAALPGSLVAAAFHHLPAREVADLARPLGHDVLVCSDHPSATEVVLEIGASVDGLRAFDAGRLSNAAAIETFTSVLLSLNRRYKARVGVTMTGLDGKAGGGS